MTDIIMALKGLGILFVVTLILNPTMLPDYIAYLLDTKGEED